MDLIAVASLEQIEEVVDEVVDLDDGIVAESRQRDRCGVQVVVVFGHVGGAPVISVEAPQPAEA